MRLARRPCMAVLLAFGAALPIHARAAAEPVVAPTHTPVVQHYGGDQGLPQSGVNALVQRRDGHLWIATHGGLARFDGRAFKVFRADPQLRPATSEVAPGSGPASDRILALHEDTRGRLWIGTQDAGISVYENGVFRSLPACRGTCQVGAFVEGADGRIWAASSAGVLRIDPDTLQAAPLRDEVPSRYDHLAWGRDGVLYAGGHVGFAAIVGDRVEPLAMPDGTDHVVLLKADGDTLWVATRSALFAFDPVDRSWRRHAVARVNQLVRDPHGRLWVGTYGGELQHEDDQGRWQAVEGLSPIVVVSLLFDDQGNLWIGTHNKGLLRLREPWIGLMADPRAAMNVPARAVIDDGEGGLWFALSCGGLRHWRADGRVDALPLTAMLGSECAATLASDRAGRIWVGTGDGYLGRLYADGTGVERIAAWTDGVAIRAIHEATDGRYWIAVDRNTYRLAIAEDGRVLAREAVGALEDMAANQIVASRRGGIWVVGDQGVLRVDVEGKRVLERWTPQQGLSSRFARAVYESPDGALWIGTYGGGLNRIRGGRVERFDLDSGLFDDTVSCLLADAEGRLWMGGNRGVSLLAAAPAGAAVETVGYTVGDGLVPAEINGGTQGACHRDPRGRLWFALVEGFAVLDPARARDRVAAAPAALVERVAVDGRSQPVAGRLQLGAAAQNIEIGYTAVDLSAPERTRFRFRLSGVNDDWIEAGRNRTIVYPSIPWGEHLFEVQARSEGGAWTSPPATLTIARSAPWYQRPWVWLLTTLLSLLLVVDGTRGADLKRRARLTRLRRRASDRSDPPAR
ncbi:MAG TPA: two-component regulator propeller domain-containing protein [Dokdonella sp.]|uniref:ligand-binding sensor domain-containing protein n=1 Tax=Dokdonella sp. TaxID=2291710 RepID=UPI002CBF5CE9|nr:two-component regulator propeller domain-containing protein [Dokdonella sp.]HUD41677.1 two-component regulator propeller domain-containing protein [Dokdonella sp.]